MAEVAQQGVGSVGTEPDACVSGRSSSSVILPLSQVTSGGSVVSGPQFLHPGPSLISLVPQPGVLKHKLPPALSHSHFREALS